MKSPCSFIIIDQVILGNRQPVLRIACQPFTVLRCKWLQDYSCRRTPGNARLIVDYYSLVFSERYRRQSCRQARFPAGFRVEHARPLRCAEPRACSTRTWANGQSPEARFPVALCARESTMLSA